MVGMPVLALAGVKVMSLVMAVQLSTAGITNNVELCPNGLTKGCTKRAGMLTVASCSSNSISLTSPDHGSMLAVCRAFRVWVIFVWIFLDLSVMLTLL